MKCMCGNDKDEPSGMECITLSQYICNKSDKKELVHVVQGANAVTGGEGGRKEGRKDEKFVVA